MPSWPPNENRPGTLQRPEATRNSSDSLVIVDTAETSDSDFGRQEAEGLFLDEIEKADNEWLYSHDRKFGIRKPYPGETFPNVPPSQLNGNCYVAVRRKGTDSTERLIFASGYLLVNVDEETSKRIFNALRIVNPVELTRAINAAAGASKHARR
jgi:hypothetical protein